MAADNIYDCVASNLICTETKSLCFDDLDSLTISQQNIETNSNDLSFNNGFRSEPLIDLPSLSEESFGFMVQREMEFLPKDDYLERLRNGDLDLSVRKEALDWIWKAHMDYGFGELSFCLSINYLDRFLSLYELPRSKTWTVQLLAVACLSLAAKMEEINVPLTVDLQVGDPKFVFEGKTIQRMELLVLSTLKWRMQAYTPCTFIDYFVRKMNGDQIPSRPLISRSIQLILSIIKGIDFLEFRSSEIAAAVAISVSGEIQAIDIDTMPCFFIHLDKGRVQKCVELIQDLPTATIITTTTASLVPQSPIGVLEAEACLSYKSGDERTVGSCTTSSHTSPNTKRRKLDTSSLEEGTTEKL
ncbi:PREDICTED: cyclin-D4-1-like [Nicotiana attenuata]|uniref:Cyclin-d2-1 n=1 Tax=Nicotiana attenuata TaxID=49451 RepID=A0A1J6IDI0_NICAT|nr:PREDICTED: cyclin-D4-1-like [Nicotiana attenuata]OIT03101.1 cyclin-d2-1 [Nicotiana attenuata]